MSIDIELSGFWYLFSRGINTNVMKIMPNIVVEIKREHSLGRSVQPFEMTQTTATVAASTIITKVPDPMSSTKADELSIRAVGASVGAYDGSALVVGENEGAEDITSSRITYRYKQNMPK